MSFIQGSGGVNIGLGLMLESVTNLTDRLDTNREIPNNIKVKDYKTWYFDLYSFIFNVVQSYESTDVDLLMKGDVRIYDTMLDRVLVDIHIIISLIGDDIPIEFYTISYDKYKNLLSSPNKETKSGKLAIKISEMIIDASKLLKEASIPYTKYVNRVKFNFKSLITTSNGLDLIHSLDISLLEYHTGVLKKRNMWYTKLKVKEPIPFEEILLLAFGDKKGYIISPLSIKEKKYLMDIILNKKLKPFNKYDKGFLINLAGGELAEKLSKLPTIY